MQDASRLKRSLVLLCFFLSGAAGLVYEVVWARQLSLFLGITSFAHTAVITAYMAGLAAGSLYFGRHADRSLSPLRTYARLEIAICIYALLTPFLFDFLQAGYADIAGVAGIAGMGGHISRFAIALAALLIPTFLMGGTLPLLVRGFVSTLLELGRAAGRLYGINTLGAMCGTLLAGYFLLPQFGILITTLVGAVVNLLIAIYILGSIGAGESRLQTGAEPGERAAKQVPNHEPPLEGLARFSVLAGFGLAGFASLLTQMAWIRALVMVVGGSVYAFTITLASFLAGIGLGSLVYARLLARRWQGLNGAALLAALIAFSLLAGLPLLQQLPAWFLAGFEWLGFEHFLRFQLFVFLLCFSIMIVPTLLMGALFPLVAVVWTRSNERAAQGVGTAYAINTAGTIFGALLGGLLILPLAGVHNGVQLAASIYVLSALLFWWPASTARNIAARTAPVLVTVPLFLLVAVSLPPWDRAVMASGVYYRANLTLQVLEDTRLEDYVAESELLYYDEGLDGTVTVKRDSDGERSLAVNGKTDASSRGDLPTQVMLGQLPLQMNRDIRDAMVIGLGSGITAGTVATDPGIEKLTILEISQEVVEASEFFRPENYGVLDDPRVAMVTADARNYLLATREQFDLIVSEPSNPWISGVSNLFTQEFFALARERLRPGGLLTQWFHTYSMSGDDFRSVLGAIVSEFEYVSVWRTLPGDLVITASREPHGIELGTVDWQNPADPEVVELNRARIFSDRDLVRLYLVGGEALRQFTIGARRNTDRHPVVEFNAPRYLYAAGEEDNMNLLFGFLGGKDLSVPVERLLEWHPGRIQSPALGLDIALPAEPEVRLRSAHWLVAHSPLQDGGYGLASQRRLLWQEGEEGVYLQADWQAERPEYQDLVALLNALVVGEIQFAGDIEITGSGEPAAWSLHLEPDTDRLRLGLAWSCAASAGRPGFNRYAAATSVPSEWHARQEYILERFASRFECR